MHSQRPLFRFESSNRGVRRNNAAAVGPNELSHRQGMVASISVIGKLCSCPMNRAKTQREDVFMHFRGYAVYRRAVVDGDRMKIAAPTPAVSGRRFIGSSASECRCRLCVGKRLPRVLLATPAIFLCLLLVCIPVPTSQAVADENGVASWDRYVPGSISEIVDSQTKLVCDGVAPGHPVWTIAGEDYARKALLTFTGLNRPTGALHREILSKWLTSLGQAPSMGEIFDREYLFHEKDRAYWIPIQAPVAAYFSTELKPNDPVLLYVVWAGAHCASDRATWLFLANEFEPVEIIPTGAQPSVT